MVCTGHREREHLLEREHVHGSAAEGVCGPSPDGEPGRRRCGGRESRDPVLEIIIYLVKNVCVLSQRKEGGRCVVKGFRQG